MTERVAVAGLATADVRKERDLKADEIVFELVSDALKQAGLRSPDVGLAMLSSLDVYDGRAISNGLIVPAAAGWGRDESRIESDVALAVTSAASAILAGQVEAAVVVAIHMPQIEGGSTDDPTVLRPFMEQISSITFDVPHGRPVGMTATAALSMQAAFARESGMVTRDAMAERAARDISAGGATSWSNRTGAVTAADVLAAAPVTNELTELMLPAESVGIVAMVLVDRTRIMRARQIHGWLTGFGVFNSAPMSSPNWLTDPGAATRRATERALSRAGVASADDIDLIEYTSLTPALQPYLEQALGIGEMDPRANATGGALSNFPGVANGGLRITEALAALGGDRRRALVHSTDNLLGPISSPAAVLVLEQP